MTDPFSTDNLTPEQEDQLRKEWPIDANGFPHRQASRVVVFDDAGRTLLILGHDVDDLDHRWWFTVGGGQDAGETPRQTALRELREETGLVVDEKRLIGPVLFRESTFHFARETRKQDENFFLLHVTAEERAYIDTADGIQLTSLERDVLDEQRWWDLDELNTANAQGETVYPRDFVRRARAWKSGWDGVLARLKEE